MYTPALLLAAVAGAGLAVAQRPANTSICDYYTTALFTNNTAANQYALLTALVNRAGTGNQTTAVKVNGIVVPGTYNGTAVDLSPYFDAGLASSNRGGSSGVCVNFLDGGVNQNTLFTHLYEYFGYLLGCSGYGTADFPAYAGHTNMYEVHKFMALDPYQVEYFIEQVGLSAASFGVAASDVAAVGAALTSTFNFRDSPPVDVIPGAAVEPQAICIDSSCPLAANASYSSYSPVVYPKPCNSTSTSNSTASCPMSSGTAKSSGCPFASKGNGTSTSGSPTAYGSATASGSPTASASGLPYTGAADRASAGVAVILLGALAALL